ncbi:MAG: DNA mismatch repair endonuclease MutL [Clostridia bacterium]|nr:DNA mismatch repair endonuclease MutL [Clostridia bacterium]
MGKINLLSFEVANLIAAGEVVDRPASVIKELMENSIDAGAKRITVEIKNGGITYMRVSDDGCGIAPEDMPLALKRHATSKIANAEDLNAIFTLGFRGEALAAISSVAKVRILSKTADAENGTLLYADGGNILSVSETGCPNGTTVTVEELFSNVPARRKFLKKDATETAAVVANVEKIALSHPEIAVRLITDGAPKLETVGDGKLENVIYSVFGRDFAKHLLKVKARNEGVDVYGFVGNSHNVKPTRAYQNFFINHRFVKSKTATAALEQAFSSYIAPERFPACVLFIDIYPGAVDVNVHPAKLEVKFSNEKLIFDTVYYAVRSELEKSTDRAVLDFSQRQTPSGSSFAPPVSRAYVPVTDRVERPKFDPEQIRIPREQDDRVRLASPSFAELSRAGKRESASAETASVESVRPVGQTHPATAAEDPQPQTEAAVQNRTEKLPLPDYRIIGIAFNTYIFVETDGKVIIIDKHAAHERIIFESMRRQIRDFAPAPQGLLVPIVISLPASDFTAALENKSCFEEIGFAFSYEENTRQIKITQIPSVLKISNVGDIFATMADQLASGAGDIEVTKREVYERVIYQASCKAAMKGGRIDSESDVRYVVEKVLTIPDLTVCPHGRPVVVTLTKHMLDRQFGRE